MKKVLFAVLLFVPIFFLLPPKTHAACNNSYYCAWDVGSNSCSGIDMADPDYCCMYGYHTDLSVCASKKNQDSCTTDVNKCVQDINPPAGYNCTSDGVCDPAPTGTTPQYTTAAACQSACTGKTITKFNCDSTQGCVEAQNGTYSGIGACTVACKKGTSVVGTCTPAGGTTGSGIETAIGCIPMLGANGTTDFLSFILKWAVGIGGGIAFLLIVYAGFMIMTAAGNPERLKAGQELLTSAISGLILLVFSIFILKFIGVDILGLGVFGFG